MPIKNPFLAPTQIQEQAFNMYAAHTSLLDHIVYYMQKNPEATLTEASRACGMPYLTDDEKSYILSTLGR